MSPSNSSLATQGPVDIMVVLVVRYLIAQISEKTSILSIMFTILSGFMSCFSQELLVPAWFLLVGC